MDFDATPPGNSYYVSFDRELMDTAFIIKEITGSYWGGWRSPATILKSMDHSICAGVFKHSVWDVAKTEKPKDEQVGFARVVTDHATFAWICDVIITADHRGKNLGKFLMFHLHNHPEVSPRACMLATRDAHDLYRKFGYTDFTAMKKLPGNNTE